MVTRETSERHLRRMIRTCRRHGGSIITINEAVKLGACPRGVNAFRNDFFPKRDYVALPELIPYLEKGHNYWSDVVIVVGRKINQISPFGWMYDWSKAREYLPKQWLRSKRVNAR